MIRRHFSALITIAVLTASCSGTTTTTTTESSDSLGGPVGVAVTGLDFEFAPESWTVPAGALLVVDFDNQGTVEHVFAIMKEGVVATSSVNLDQSLVYRELRAAPGATTSDTFPAPSEPGSYQVICTVSGHLEIGMTAELIVEP